MSADLVFMMGNFEATFPTDRLYAKNHMWAQSSGEKRFRLGLSAYAVRLLQDVYFLDLTIESGMPLKARQEIGSIESKKAESSLYTPTEGTVIAINQALLDDPTGINLDKYGAGWLFEIESAGSEFLQPPQYMEHLQGAWEIAQRTIKGQVNA
jgi:glycine cleavage system H protein